MNTEQESNPLKIFNFEDNEQPVSFVETSQVADGVECDVYAFDKDNEKDLGLIRIMPGKKTPLQRVLKGDRTIEGYISGKGKFTLTKPNGEKQITEVDEKTKRTKKFDVHIGELMQWEADPQSELMAYEICFPPYQEGRFENIR